MRRDESTVAEIEAVPQAFAIGVPRIEDVGIDRTALKMLAEVPLFKDLSKRHLHKLGRVAKAVRYSSGRVIVKDGSPGKAFFVIVTGKATVVADVGNRVLAGLGPGDFFGELALLDGGPRTASVVADSAVETVQLSRKAFQELVMNDPEVGLRIMKDLAGRIRDLTRALSG